MRIAFRWIGAVAALVSAPAAAAVAQDFSYGERLFAQNCSSCHGATGAGDGPVAELFAQRPRNLRLLRQEVDGAFPFVDVYQAVDGRRAIRAHGTEMPVWGSHFLSLAEAQGDVQLLLQGMSGEDIVQARILAIVYYIQTLQLCDDRPCP